jgi:hypothetical protein
MFGADADKHSIVGALARSQAPAFSTALMFAQEYGILAVSEEDRPFMPVTTIVLEGVPRDMKAVFRHWNDGLIPTALGWRRPSRLREGRAVGIKGSYNWWCFRSRVYLLALHRWWPKRAFWWEIWFVGFYGAC